MEALPFGSAKTVTGGVPTMVLAPHPDDESLGCGGFIAQLCTAGVPPLVLVITDGTGSHPHSASYPPPRLRAVREVEMRDAGAALGLDATRIEFLRFPDTAAPTSGPEFHRAVDAIEAHCRRHSVGTVLSPWKHDPHGDHWATHLMARAAAERLGLRHWAYPVWGWLLPPETPVSLADQGIRLDITADLPQKRRAIASHRSQCTDLITDDPAGFRLPPELLQVFDRPFETFLRLG